MIRAHARLGLLLPILIAISSLAAPAQAQVQRTGYSITFEANDGAADGWASASTPTAIWAHGAPTITPAATSGTKCWGTGLTADYPDDAAATLTSPIYDLSGTVRPRLKFFHHMDSESSFDGGQVQVSRNGGAFISISQTDPAWLQGGPNSSSIDGLNNEAGWSGNPMLGTWTAVVLDLNAITAPGLTSMTASDDVRFRFRFGSDSSVTAPGWFIDDVQFVSGPIPEKTYTGDTTGKARWNRPFETGTSSTTATNTPFEIQPITVPAGGTGAYTITANWTDGQDGYLFVYNTPFNPGTPLANYVAGDDDFGTITKSQIASVNLVAGQTYVIVATGFLNSDDGRYTIKIDGGPSAIRFLAGGPAFDAGIDATPRSGELPLRVQFTDASTAGATAWRWDFGDGATSTEENPSHVYMSSGTFDVSLEITAGTRTATTLEPGFIEVIRGELPKRKVLPSNGCALAPVPFGASAAAGSWGPLCAAVAVLAASRRRRRLGGQGSQGSQGE